MSNAIMLFYTKKTYIQRYIESINREKKLNNKLIRKSKLDKFDLFW